MLPGCADETWRAVAAMLEECELTDAFRYKRGSESNEEEVLRRCYGGSPCVNGAGSVCIAREKEDRTQLMCRNGKRSILERSEHLDAGRTA